MLNARRPFGRFFCLVSILALLLSAVHSLAVSARTTRIADTVYRAYGAPAQGTILISWPAFTSATGEAIAAGRTTVAIGPNGAIDVPLVANTGSSPSSFYTVVLKLDDGATATEYWTVPSATATTVAAIRSKVVPASVAAQYVGRDYVDTADSANFAALNSALAAKADDTAVVHYAGDETIGGRKVFSASPVVPTPTAAGDAANKTYVDNAVQVSFGNVLSATPSASQIITQPSGTSFQVNRADVGNLNGVRSADHFPAIQNAIADAGSTGAIVIPPGYSGADNFTNPDARPVLDLRRLGDFRGGDISVKDFGARGDAGTYGYARCTSGSNTITNVAAGQGRLPKVGDTIVAAGCGASGADLQCTVNGGTATTGTNYGTVTCGSGVTAATTKTTAGARWGSSVDDTQAFVDAINYCDKNGCTIKVPAGVYFVSNVTFLAKGNQSGEVTISGAGKSSSWIVGIGADQTAIFTTPGSSTPTKIQNLGFLGSYDYNNKKQIAIRWAGGSYHTVQGDFFSNVYRGVQAANTWINLISNNVFYGGKTYIEFGGTAGTGPVNATRVVFNEFGAGFSEHAIWTHTNNASYENTYLGNSIENDNAPFDSPVVLGDNGSTFILEYTELVASTSGYGLEITGGNNVIQAGYGLGCTHVSGTGNTFYTKPAGYCSGQTYTFKMDAYGQTWYGVSPENLSGSGSSDVFYGYGPSASQLALKGLRVYNNNTSSSAWLNGRVDIAGIPFMSSVNAFAYNPSYPTDYTPGATVIPSNTLIFNKSGNPGTLNSNAFWLCKNSSGCATNALAGADFWRLGRFSNKVHSEATAAPATGNWTVGDFVWNTNPASNKILGWLCTSAGAPGTWQTVYAFDPANAPAIGATTPASVKATTVNATAGYQVNGTALVSSCGTTATCANTALASARTVTGSVTLASGSATVSGISPAFASTSSFVCTCTDQAATPAACSVQNASASSITVKGNATDTLNYMCVGN